MRWSIVSEGTLDPSTKIFNPVSNVAASLSGWDRVSHNVVRAYIDNPNEDVHIKLLIHYLETTDVAIPIIFGQTDSPTDDGPNIDGIRYGGAWFSVKQL